MALKDFEIPTEVVSFQGGTVRVRGVSLNDISYLIRDHLVELNNLMAMYGDENKRELAVSQSVDFAVNLVTQAPEVVAKLIARVQTEEEETPDLVVFAGKLPIGVQVEIIRKVWDLTVEEAGGAKKLFDTLMGMVKSIRPASKNGD